MKSKSKVFSSKTKNKKAPASLSEIKTFEAIKTVGHKSKASSQKGPRASKETQLKKQKQSKKSIQSSAPNQVIRSEVLRPVRGFVPQIGENVFVADNARIIGDVQIGSGSSIWYSVTLRGDVMPIKIGNETNIQDGSVLHGTYGKVGCVLGDRVTIGHLAMLHGCEIGNSCLIGMGSILMDGSQIGEQSIVAAGSLVTEGSVFPPRSLIMGRPAVRKRELTDEELKRLEYSADNYLEYMKWYK